MNVSPNGSIPFISFNNCSSRFFDQCEWAEGARRALALRALVVPRWEVTKRPSPGGSHGQFTIRAHDNLADLSAAHANGSLYQFWLSPHRAVDWRGQSGHGARQCLRPCRLLAATALGFVLPPQALGPSPDGALGGRGPDVSLSTRTARPAVLDCRCDLHREALCPTRRLGGLVSSSQVRGRTREKPQGALLRLCCPPLHDRRRETAAVGQHLGRCLALCQRALDSHPGRDSGPALALAFD